MAAAPAADAAQLRSLVHRQRHAIAEIAARHGAHQVRLVGSVARGDHGATSDIDLPMVGGIPPDRAWESLRLFEQDVLPHLV
jgi:predicted nucleotidyltransferase